MKTELQKCADRIADLKVKIANAADRLSVTQTAEEHAVIALEQAKAMHSRTLSDCAGLEAELYAELKMVSTFVETQRGY